MNRDIGIVESVGIMCLLLLLLLRGYIHIYSWVVSIHRRRLHSVRRVLHSRGVIGPLELSSIIRHYSPDLLGAIGWEIK